jgi:hypothetical protein
MNDFVNNGNPFKNLVSIMRAILILTIFSSTLWACNSTIEKKGGTVDSSKLTKQVSGTKYFEYDSIDYYSNRFDESKIGELYDNQYKSEADSFKIGIILGQIPKSITDLAFIDKLAKIGYKKTFIDKVKFDSIDKIFMEKITIDNIVTGCIYVYRDILIFKKNSKVVGTAKVCFGCMANQIHGTTASTENFGQDGDYGKLAKLLGL